jgi:outer membrane protein assembly factor BamB
VFISTGYGIGCVLLDINSGNPKVLWQNKNMNNHVSTCVLIGGYLYGCHDPVGWGGGGILRCLDLKGGEVMWEKDFGGTVSISAAGKALIVLSQNGTLSIAEASPKSYNEISCARIFKNLPVKCWTLPVFCDGKIYCRNFFGDLACIDMRK